MTDMHKSYKTISNRQMYALNETSSPRIMSKTNLTKNRRRATKDLIKASCLILFTNLEYVPEKQFFPMIIIG